MAVQRFVLDSTTLDNAGFGLDGGAAFILDTSTLDGAAVLDGGEFLTVATGSSSLGGLSASATARVTVQAVASSSLGGVTGAATARVTVQAVASSSLGAVSASATARVTVQAVASASLGGLSATASARTTIFPVLSASLGALVASATATVIPPEPPVIPPSGSRWWRQPAIPVVEQVIPDPIYVQVPQPRRPVLVSAVAGSRLGGFDVGALGSVTFSILNDDAEVLLLV